MPEHVRVYAPAGAAAGLVTHRREQGAACFDSTYVQGSRFKVDLCPLQVDQFGRPQAVPIGDKDHRGVAVAPAVVFGGRDEPFDLVGGQILPSPQVAVGDPFRGNCSI